MQRQGQRAYTIGFFGFMSILGAILIFMYAQTFGVEQTVFISATLFLAVGILLAWTTVGIRWEPFAFKSFMLDLIWTAVSFGAIYLTNQLVPFRLEVQNPVGVRLFAVLQGVAEECFFRLWLCTFFYKVSRSLILAVVVSSGIWTFYHIARYGGNQGAFIIIFASGIMLGYVMLESKRADGVIFAHALVNFMAS